MKLNDILSKFYASKTRKRISGFSVKLNKQAEQPRRDLVT